MRMPTRSRSVTASRAMSSFSSWLSQEVRCRMALPPFVAGSVPAGHRCLRLAPRDHAGTADGSQCRSRRGGAGGEAKRPPATPHVRAGAAYTVGVSDRSFFV